MTAAPADVPMPRLSDSMEEGVVLNWLKQPGDAVAVGDPLVEIETDKAKMVYEADTAGALVEILVGEGEAAHVGAVIARLGEPGVAPSTNSSGGPTGPRESARADGRVKASPVARRLAAEHGIELAAVAGSGPGGRIVKADVEALVASGSAPTAERSVAPSATSGPAQAGITSPLIPSGTAPPAQRPSPASAGPLPGATEVPETAKGTTQTVELTKLQATVARRMAESKATAPHFYLGSRVDMSAAMAARGRVKAATPEGEVVPSFNDMVVKACAIALRENQRANGAQRDGKLELYSRVNVGVAVAAQNALVVPTVFDADLKGLRQIASEAQALAQRVREGSITPAEVSGGTFTVSNLGMYGISNFGAVINPPQAAILAVGEITETPVVRDGEITTAHLMGVTLACDHRILNGAEAAEFFGRIRALLEEPLGLAL